jgi:peroxiredoxin
MLTFLGALSFVASAVADEPKTVSEVQSAHDKALIVDLLSYLTKHPRADDLDQAYMKIFDKVIEHDWFAENEGVARKYLAEHPEGPVKSLAQIVGTMARAQAGKFPEALASFNALMAGLGGADQEEFAANFADTLATSAMSAGEHEIARKVYQSLLRKFGTDSPNLAQRTKDEIARIDRVGTPAPSVAVNDLSGSPIRMEDLRGKYVLVDFWATWCAPCVVELPRLQAAYAKYHQKGFEILAVSLDEAKSSVVDFVKARKLPWKQVHNATGNGDLVEAFGVKNIPATFLIDPSGHIVRLELRGPALDRALEALIK